MKFTDLLTPVIGLSLGSLLADYLTGNNMSPGFISGVVACGLALWINAMRFRKVANER